MKNSKNFLIEWDENNVMHIQQLLRYAWENHFTVTEIPSSGVDVVKLFKESPCSDDLTTLPDCERVMYFLRRVIQPLFDSLQRRCEAAERNAEIEYQSGYKYGVSDTESRLDWKKGE